MWSGTRDQQSYTVHFSAPAYAEMMVEEAGDDIRDINARRNVALLTRKILEDKHLRLMEEIFLLKKHARLQEDKMKKMATKLLKLSSGSKDGGKRDLELEERLEMLQTKVRKLLEEKASLKNKVMVLRLQQDNGRRLQPDHAPCSHREQGGSKTSPMGRLAAAAVTNSIGTQASMPGHPQYGQSLLNDARKDNLILESAVLGLKESLSALQYKLEREHDEHTTRESALLEENKALRKTATSLMEEQQRSGIAEDVERIHLERQVRQQASSVVSLQVQQQGLERQLQAVHQQNAMLLAEMEGLQGKAKENISSRIAVDSQISNTIVSSKAFVELEEMVRDLRREKDALKQTNDRLLQTSMDDSRSIHLQRQVSSLQNRVLSAEEELAVRASQANDVCEKLASEKVVSEALRNEAAMLKAQLNSLYQQRNSMDDKIKLLSKGSGDNRGDAKFTEGPAGSVGTGQPHHPGNSQAEVVKNLRSELQDRLRQIANLQNKVSFHQNLSSQNSSQLSQLKQMLSDITLARSSQQDKASQTTSIERVSSSAQTCAPSLLLMSVAVQTAAVSARAMAVQTRPAGSTSVEVQTDDEPAWQTSPSPFHQTMLTRPASPPVSGGDDNVVMDHLVPHSTAQSSAGARTVAIGIHSLRILPNSSVGKDSRIARLFVEYEFLTFDTNDLETPMSLWKPSNGQRMIFNFRQTFCFDPVDSKDVCQELRKALLSSSRTDYLVTFTVVCDPEEPDGECREVGTAGLAVQDVREKKGESLHAHLPVLVGQDSNQQEVIGQLEISVEGLNIINCPETP